MAQMKNTSGIYILPFLVYKGVNIIEGLLNSASVLSGTVAAFTDTGYMHKDIFEMYIEHFNNSILPTRPVLLMLDGATSHIDLTKTPFKKLKTKYNKALNHYCSNNKYKIVTKYLFAQVF
ncbi:20937_t:CDS:2, partial [Cetraspora pellucida]